MIPFHKAQSYLLLGCKTSLFATLFFSFGIFSLLCSSSSNSSSSRFSSSSSSDSSFFPFFGLLLVDFGLVAVVVDRFALPFFAPFLRSSSCFSSGGMFSLSPSFRSRTEARNSSNSVVTSLISFVDFVIDFFALETTPRSDSKISGSNKHSLERLKKLCESSIQCSPQ